MKTGQKVTKMMTEKLSVFFHDWETIRTSEYDCALDVLEKVLRD